MRAAAQTVWQYAGDNGSYEAASCFVFGDEFFLLFLLVVVLVVVVVVVDLRINDMF
jgi:hypothetical protein